MHSAHLSSRCLIGPCVRVRVVCRYSLQKLRECANMLHAPEVNVAFDWWGRQRAKHAHSLIA